MSELPQHVKEAIDKRADEFAFTIPASLTNGEIEYFRNLFIEPAEFGYALATQEILDLKAEIERLKGEKSDAVEFIIWVRGNATPAQYCTWIYKGKSGLSSGELYDIFKSTK